MGHLERDDDGSAWKLVDQTDAGQAGAEVGQTAERQVSPRERLGSPHEHPSSMSAAGSMNPDSGTEVIRASLAAHSKSGPEHRLIAHDLRVPAEALLGFLDRRLPLPSEVLQALAKILFHGHAEGGCRARCPQTGVSRPAQET